MEVKKDAAIRKRQMILDSSKKMFFWVAGASVLVGFALVVSWFLVQRIVFMDRVIRAKNETLSVLEKNNKVVPDLKDGIRVLETNEDLMSAKATPAQRTLQVILDALPADSNEYALGASVQSVLLGGAENIELESFAFNEDATSASEDSADGVVQVGFSASISSSDTNSITQLLERLERSIRTIVIDDMQIQKTNDKTSITIQAHAFYMPEKVVELGTKTIKPDGKD